MNTKSIIKKLLHSRGLKQDEEIERFLNPDYELHTHDPFLLSDMERAVERLARVKKNKECVYVYGDYDIDGLSATSLLLDAFDAFGIDAKAYIPDRFEEGYGLNFEALKKIQDQGADLVVTVDCGSVSVDVIEEANSKLAIDIIVTDHHTVGNTLPDCVAVVNPKREDNTYPFNDLAGVGVAFKLVQAMQQRMEGLEHGQEKWLLDLVALGTVCDVVGLVDENRVFVKWGLEVWRQTRRPGLQALLEVSNVENPDDIDATTMGFRIGPRLNASGRMKHAQTSLDVLTSTSLNKARKYARQLDEFNSNRRTDQARILDEARAMAEQDSNPVLVVASENWSHGIVGIVAAKLLEEFNKPTFVLEILPEKKVAKGSARSFGDFKAVDAVRAFPNRLSGGGHAAAAGVTISQDHIEDFKKAVNDYYDSLDLSNQDKYLDVTTDIELDSFNVLTTDLIAELQQLAPFGQQNEEPLFLIKNVRIHSQRLVGAQKNHLQITIQDSSGNIMKGIHFNSGKHPESIASVTAIAKASTYRPGTVELIVKKIDSTLA